MRGSTRRDVLATMNPIMRGSWGAPKIRSLLVPGLGTGVGDMPPERAARQMRIAYDAIMGGLGQKERNAGAIWGEHSDLLF